MSEGCYWIVRLKCEALPAIMGETAPSYIEERRIWAQTQEDAIAKAASQSNAETVSGATVEEDQ